MQQKELGSTGVMLPEIGFGTWQYTGGVGPLRRGMELGAFLVDTAELYETEDQVGKAARGRRESMFIATKVSPEHFKRNDLLKAADDSLQRLETDYIDLYQLHWPNPSVPIEETMNAMEFLVDVGKVKFIGVSNFSVGQMDEAQNTMEKYKIVSNQVKFSLIDRSIESEILPYCQENNITVMAYTPLARDLKNFRSKAMDKVRAMVAKSEAQVALNWCISKDNVVAIPKANSIEHVEDDCGASDWKLSTEHIRLLEEEFKQVV